MKGILHTIFVGMWILFGVDPLSAQNPTLAYAIQFTDKSHSPYSIDQPSDFLSPKAIDRRLALQIAIDETDLPISPTYIDLLENTCHCTVNTKSKWFNTAVVHLADSTALSSIRQLDCVSQVYYLGNVIPPHTNRTTTTKWEENTDYPSEVMYSQTMYGRGKEQIEMLNGHLLHELGYTGKGMDIAVIDAGFSGVDYLPIFERLRSEGRIRMTRDFAFDHSDMVYNWSNHGTSVLSILAGSIRDSLIGTAPEANYFLFRSENVTSETPQEEYNWAAAAELCDSLGIDIINTSLGYSGFDDPQLSYQYADMDGNTTIITRAADWAAGKGMLIINSAGNEGDDPWHYITAPADGDSVLAVGAVNLLAQHAPFSGYGPSYDQRTKPNVCTIGQDAAYAAMDSTIRRGNGTSFSAPVLTGMAACLWQAFPQKRSMEIFHAIEQSAHRYLHPNDELGYGIPNFWHAFQLLQSSTNPIGELQIELFPNPCADYLNLVLKSNSTAEVLLEIYSADGKRVIQESGVLWSQPTGVLQFKSSIERLAAGCYTLIVRAGDQQSTAKFMKLPTER